MAAWPGIVQIVFTLRLASLLKTLPLALACLHASVALAQPGAGDPARMRLSPEQRQQMWQQMTPEQRDAARERMRERREMRQPQERPRGPGR